MIIFLLGYFVMELIFVVWCLFYHALNKDNPISALGNDFANLYAYNRQIILSNPMKLKIIAVIFITLNILTLMPFQDETIKPFDSALSTVVYFLMAITCAPQKNPTSKKFPVEIFGFIYSIVLMYYSAGEFVLTLFETGNSLGENVWIYGYSVVCISYVICIATLSDFMERNLSQPEIIFVGMIMMTTLEFMTYYGVGFFGGMDFYYNLEMSKISVLEEIIAIINQGIFIASQSQILERSTKEVCGYIILNGTDVLTVTAGLGYVLQKFMGSHDESE